MKTKEGLIREAVKKAKNSMLIKPGIVVYGDEELKTIGDFQKFHKEVDKRLGYKAKKIQISLNKGGNEIGKILARIFKRE